MKHKRILNKLISILLIILVCLGNLSTRIPVQATNLSDESMSTSMGDISVTGQNSLGNLLAGEISGKLDEQEANNGYNVFSVEMEGTKATVEYEAVEACTLVVGIYDESGISMLASGSAEVTQDETTAIVTIETDAMPAYFDVKAYLVDKDSWQPISTEYETPNYTQEMQEFFQKTVTDFDEERVVNLDEDTTTNFLVFNQDTKILEQNGTSNQVASIDDVNKNYVIEQADSDVTSLQTGDIFAYYYGEDELLIVKVADVSVDGTTVTILGEDFSMDETFEFVRIEGESYTGDAQIDASGCDEGVTYNGLVEEQEEVSINEIGMPRMPHTRSEALDENDNIYIHRATEVSGYKTWTHSYTVDKEVKNGENRVKVSGTVNLKITASIKLYLSITKQYLELGMDYSLKGNLSFSLKLQLLHIPLALLEYQIAPGAYIRLTPSLVVEVDGKMEWSGELKGKIGCRATGTGIKNTSTNPKIITEFKIEGTAFIGLDLEPQVKILSDEVAQATLNVMAGAEISGKYLLTNETDKNVVHDCQNCIAGEIKARIAGDFSAQFLDLENLKFKISVDNKVKLSDFHYSFDYNEFSFAKCPHIRYQVTATVLDATTRKAVKGAVVLNKYTTDEKGQATFYLPVGKHKITVTKTGYQYMNLSPAGIVINEKPKNIELLLLPTTETANKGDDVQSGTEEKGDDDKEDENGNVIIDEITFPDEVFRQYVAENFDKNSDGVLSRDERDLVEEIDVSGAGIKSLEGIKYFEQIVSLECGHNNLDSLDMSGCETLTYLDCMYNKLSSLNVSNCIALEFLNASYNYELKILDTSGCMALTFLECHCDKLYSGLYSLDVSDCIALEFLDCTGNMLGSLDVSGCVSLIYLRCSGNQLGRIDVSNCVALEELYCNSNALRSLDVSGSATLTCLECSGNYCIDAVNLSGCTALKSLSCYNSSLRSLDVSGCTSLERLACYKCNLNTLDVSDCVTLRRLNCYANDLGGLDVSNCINLGYLDCSANDLSGLDVSNCINLGYLDCWANNLNDLDVSDCTTLTYLSCTKNELNSLDVSKCIELKTLHCGQNTISSLDVSNCTKLTDIYWDSTCTIVDSLHRFDTNSADISPSILPEEEDLSIEAKDTELLQNSADTDIKTVTYTSLTPDEIYNFYLMKNRETEQPFASGNLLYIDQYIADSAGTVSVSYKPIGTYENVVPLLIGMNHIDLAYADVWAADLYQNGSTQSASLEISYNGELLTEGEDYELTGDVTATDLGTYQITITGTGTYYGTRTVSWSMKSGSPKAVSSITLSTSRVSLAKGEELALRATITPADASNSKVKWQSSNEQVATVNTAGKLRAVGSGTCTITCSAADGNGAKAVCQVTVTDSARITGIQVSSMNISQNEQRRLEVTLTPASASGKNLSFSSSHPSVAVVTGNGVVTGVAPGQAVITVEDRNSNIKAVATLTVYSQTQAFCARLYEKCLGRQAEADGLAYWNQVLVSKEKSGAQVGYGFVFSEEYKNKHTSDEDYIEMLYQVFMNRSSDVLGKNYWLGLLTQGVSREYVYQGFAHSQEYTNICNSYGIERGTVTLTQARDKNPNLTAFVNRIYEKAMERSGEEDGLNYWCSMIQNGSKSPIQVAEFFLTSEEFRNKNLSNEAYIKVLYRTFMGRECDQGGLNYWLGELNRGCSREDVLHRFAGCPEFKDIIASFGI